METLSTSRTDYFKKQAMIAFLGNNSKLGSTFLQRALDESYQSGEELSLDEIQEIFSVSRREKTTENPIVHIDNIRRTVEQQISEVMRPLHQEINNIISEIHERVLQEVPLAA